MNHQELGMKLRDIDGVWTSTEFRAERDLKLQEEMGRMPFSASVEWGRSEPREQMIFET